MDDKQALRLPSLIQRVTRRPEARVEAKGLDSIFSFDYMGSSEFEWGAIPKALKAMRATRNKAWEIRTISALGKTCYYVGDPETFGLATQLFEDQLRPRETRQGYTKEFTYIYETFNPDPKRHQLGPFDAWWAVDPSPLQIPFILFKNKAHAEEWMRLL